jgi:hypothetical protein
MFRQNITGLPLGQEKMVVMMPVIVHNVPQK